MTTQETVELVILTIVVFAIAVPSVWYTYRDILRDDKNKKGRKNAQKW